MFRWNKKLCVEYITAMRSPLEEMMASAPLGPGANQSALSPEDEAFIAKLKGTEGTVDGTAAAY